MLISGAVLIVAGLVLLFFPVTTTKMIAYIAAAMLLFMGIGQVIGYFRYEPGSGRYSSGLVLGIFLMIVGLLIYYPDHLRRGHPVQWIFQTAAGSRFSKNESQKMDDGISNRLFKPDLRRRYYL